MRRAPNCPVTLMLVSALCGLAVSSAAIAADQATPTVSPTTATPTTDTPTTVSPAAPAAQGPVAPATSGAQAPAAAAPAAAPAAEPAQQSAESKITCRTVKTTGSRLQTRKVCSTPDSQKGSADWVREQQARGAIGASAIVNGQ
jgi:hypothetical protein